MIILINIITLFHRTIKIKPIEVTDNYYAGYNDDPSNKKRS